MVCWIVVGRVDHSLCPELLREALGATTIVHAGALWVGCATRTVNHVGEDQVLEALALHLHLLILSGFRVRGQFGNHNAVHQFICESSVLIGQDDEDVGMWQTPLLELYHVHVGHYLSKHSASDEIMH